MSVSGSIWRQLDLCSLRWERHIPEQGPTSTLMPGWHLTITLPFVDLSVSDFGHSLKRRLSKPTFYVGSGGVDVYVAGLALGLGVDNGNDGELGQSGDCTVLG